MFRKEAVLELLAICPPSAFSYDAELKEFTIGTERVPLNDFNKYRRDVSPVDPITPEQAQVLIDENNLLLNAAGTRHYQMPRMYTWLSSLSVERWKQISNTVTEVMVDSFAEVNDTSREQLRKGSHWGFGVGLYRPGHPSFRVLGDCACYGVSPFGHVFKENSWGDGFAEYDGHNIDSPVQRIVLYAGAGALAAMVED